MFSGKTDELLRLLRRAEIAGRRVMLVRPTIDDRTAPEVVESRSGVAYRAAAGRQRVGDPAARRPASARRSWPSTRPSSSTTACREVAELLASEGRSVHRVGPRPGLPGATVRPDAGAAGPGRPGHQADRHLHRLRRGGDAHAAHRRRPAGRGATTRSSSWAAWTTTATRPAAAPTTSSGPVARRSGPPSGPSVRARRSDWHWTARSRQETLQA